MKPTKRDWVPLDKARFTADANPVLNFDAGETVGCYFLATGGNIENKTTKLREIITVYAEKSAAKPPADLPHVESRPR